jgi:hypothetical protein
MTALERKEKRSRASTFLNLKLSKALNSQKIKDKNKSKKER